MTIDQHVATARSGWWIMFLDGIWIIYRDREPWVGTRNPQVAVRVLRAFQAME